MRFALLAVACVLLFPGCDFGLRTGASAQSDGNARATAAKVSREWKVELQRRAREETDRRFPNVSQATFLRRLRAAAEQYDFEILAVRFLRPKQFAPRVIVQSDEVEELAADLPSFIRSIDPKARTADDRTGWAFEGFLLEARDSRGVPAFTIYNWWRGRSPGGGQWAREESLYPFSHG